MIQPLLAFADLGFFLLRIFLGIILLEEGWRGMRALLRERRHGALPWMLPSACALLGLLLVAGAATQLVAALAVLFVAPARHVRESLFPTARERGLFAAALLVLVFAGGGLLSVDQLFGLVLY